MSFEDLDNNFEKVAKTPLKTDVQRETADERTAKEGNNEHYEKSFKENQLSGLLAVFQEKLRNRTSTEDGDSEEFETVNITSNAVMPTNASVKEEVSEEEISKLMNPPANKYSEKFENIDTSVERTVSTHTRRYDEDHPTIENVIRPEDLPAQQASLNNADRPPIARTANEQIGDAEIEYHLAEHNRKKAEKKAHEQEEPSDNSNSE